MIKALGLNWYLLVGVVGLIISIGLITYGLKNNVANKTFFNVSRFLALLSVIGVWYFGNILTKNTTNEIESNKLKTAEAIEQTKSLELDLTNAKKDVEIAKHKTEEVKLEIEEAKRKTAEIQLEVERAEAEAAKAKLERDLLKQQTNSIEIETNRLRSIQVNVEIEIEHDGNYKAASGRGSNHSMATAKMDFINDSDEVVYTFVPGQIIKKRKLNETKLVILNEYRPASAAHVNTKSIKSLEDVTTIKLAIRDQLKSFLNVDKKPIKIVRQPKGTIRVLINDVETILIEFIITDNKGHILTHTPIEVKVSEYFQNVLEKYIEKTGRKK